MGVYSVDRLMGEARRLAAEYRRATGKTLPISNEIAISDAVRLLGLEPAPDDAPAGTDAIGTGAWEGEAIQIKARALFDEGKSKPRIGQLALEKSWDRVLLVLMDASYETEEILAADRATVEASLAENPPGEKRRRRGAMSVARFRILAEVVWTRDEGRVHDEVWDNQRDA